MKKQKILIIDDSKLNREILADMLGDYYETEEAENGEQALEILEKSREDFSLVLLDLKMPVMDGYEVLYTMKARAWLDTLPVICVSSETSGESIRRSYDLGASDYFIRPFDADTVFHRVQNTIALNKKMSGGMQDAMEMLSAIFYQILKLNLTEDTYTVFKGAGKTRLKLENASPKLSDCLNIMAEAGYIYKDDKEEYLRFCNVENLKKKMEDGNDRVLLNYRCKIQNEFRWVSMEIVKSAEYTPTEQIAMLYLRDINDEYLKQLDVVTRRARDSVATVTMNVSEGICISGSSRSEKLDLKQSGEKIDDFICRISQAIPRQKEREEFVQKFSCQNLLENFSRNKTSLVLEYPVYSDKGMYLRMSRATVEMIRNSVENQIEAMMCFTDITAAYLNEKIPHLLYKKNFNQIAVIDIERKGLGIDTPENFDMSKYLEQELAYDDYVAEITENSIPPEEQMTFLQCTQLETIKKELDRKGKYSFTIHQFNANGEKRLKNYNYLYLTKSFGVAVATVEDVTEISDQDILTGGYNRQGFIRQVEKILRNSEDRTEYAVMFFNIKNFKAVNELLGTEFGDLALRNFYRDLNRSVLQPLITARVEADHFTCLVKRENLNYEKLTEMCQRKLIKGGKSLHLYARCGIFLIDDENIPVNGMIDRAKLAKKYIEDEYVQAYKVYDSSMHSAYIDKAELSSELEEGIAQGQFRVYFQPVVDARTGEITAAEALIRWIHPEKGFISPAVFIPALEESGHISELDFYVLKAVNEFQKKRYEAGKPVVPVSVNLSWMDFYDENIMDWLKEKCKDTSMPTRLCRLEVTETSYAAIEQNRNATLDSLREAGIQILLDDFGSGYSSFGMIQNYNFDIMKIDMSFVRQIENNAKTRSIIRFMIDMAHEMGIRLVAEGAETPAQVKFLQENKCDAIQGYYFYKPMPEEDFVKALERTETENVTVRSVPSNTLCDAQNLC